MHSIIIKIAGVNLLIEYKYSQTRFFLEEFSTKDFPQYRIAITNERLQNEQAILIHKFPQKKFSVCEIERNVLYRDIPKILFKEKVIVFHGVLICYLNKGYIFTAPSGMGKSTHADLWKKKFGDKVCIINGDKPLLKLTESGVIAYGSPWKGKENIGNNRSVKLNGICFLERSDKNFAQNIEMNAEVLTWLLNQTQIYGLEHFLHERMKWLIDMSKYIYLYKLWCNVSDDAVSVAHKIMTS